METLEWRFEDVKSKMPDGEWQTEPDKKQWLDPKTNLPCLIVRGPVGALCGYVGIPNTHPYYGKDYNRLSLDVHGGLTFADKCQPHEDNKGICHIAPPEEDDVWWLGFDCAHHMDVVPGLLREYSSMMPKLFSGNTYRNFDYVTKQCEFLAEQLHSMNHQLSILGRVHFRQIKKLLPKESKPSKNSLWFWVDYAEQDIFLTTKFKTLSIGKKQIKDYEMQIVKVTNELGGEGYGIERGYKSICCITFTPKIPKELKTLPILAGWKNQKKKIIISE